MRLGLSMMVMTGSQRLVTLHAATALFVIQKLKAKRVNGKNDGPLFLMLRLKRCVCVCVSAA